MKSKWRGSVWVLFRHDWSQYVREVIDHADPVFKTNNRRLVNVRFKSAYGQLYDLDLDRNTARMLARRINQMLETTK